MSIFKTGVAGLVAVLAATACSHSEVSFKNNVFPILQKNCSVCHSPSGVGYANSGFSVVSYQAVMKGTSNGRVITPGSSVASTLVRLIQHQADQSINMPKEYQVIVRDHREHFLLGKDARWLSKEDIDIITKWVDQGAKDN